MGMSASQVRLLTITKRIHEVENDAERTQNQKMLLGLQSDEAYEEYLAAMEKKDIEYAWFNGNTGNFEWNDLDLQTVYDLINKTGTDYRLKVKNLTYQTQATTDSITFPEGQVEITNLAIRDIDGQNNNHLFGNYNGTVIDMGPYSGTLQSGSITFGAQFNISNGKATATVTTPATVNNITIVPEWIECENIAKVKAALNITDENALTDKTIFRELVYNAYAIIEAKLYDEDLQKKVWKETSVATNVGLREKTDDEELAKAEANYEAALRRIDKKEEQYDKDLAKYDQERKALTSQLDTLKTCIKENIDRTFKIFQG